MGNKLVGRHRLHIYPFEPAEIILDPQSFFKQSAKFNLTQVDIVSAIYRRRIIAGDESLEVRCYSFSSSYRLSRRALF